jgi:hypothetical protein
MPGYPLSQDLVVAWTLFGGIRIPSKGPDTLLGSSVPYLGVWFVRTGIRRFLVEVRSN